MAKVTTKEINIPSRAFKFNSITKRVSFYVNSKGLFYVILPEDYKASIENTFNQNLIPKKGKIKVFCSNMDELEKKLKKALLDFYSPEIQKEPVIVYNIDSHIAFVQSQDGDIFPNGSSAGADYGKGKTYWVGEDMYGSHYSSSPCKNGYSLKIGAKAMLKITYKYGDSKKVEYEIYSGDIEDSNSSAKKLNSWCSFSLDVDRCEQIPYTDNAANFFYDLMMGMAKLSQLIQNKTHDKNMLQIMIDENTKLLK